MSHWAGLYPAEDKEVLAIGAELMLQIAIKLLNKKAKIDECR
jgi:hypothetical protein